jgi:predicted TIM-barrel fold metal-dependent hydrolase
MDVSEFSYVWTTQRDDYVIYSLDYPYVEVGDSYAFLMDSGLTGEAKELIAHVNAERLLHV